jgi:NADH:ubiquinone oxidoreductase subunit E
VSRKKKATKQAQTSGGFYQDFKLKRNGKQLVPVCVTADMCSPPIYG